MPDQSQERDDDPALTKMLGALPGERLFSRRDDVSTSPAVEESALSERVEEMRDLAERARLRAEVERLRVENEKLLDVVKQCADPNVRGHHKGYIARGVLAAVEEPAERVEARLRQQLERAVKAVRAVTADAETLVIRDDTYDVRVPAEAWNALRELGGQ